MDRFQKCVVHAAEKFYYSWPGAAPADVLVYSRNDWTRVRDAAEMGRALAMFVTNNYPSHQETVVLQEHTRGVIGWVDGLHVVRITRESGSWQAGACSGIESVTYDRLAEVIADKNQKVSTYRSRVPGWQIWLLIVTRMPVLWSVSIPREVTAWRFSCDFDRVFLSSWEDGVLELKMRKHKSRSGGPVRKHNARSKKTRVNKAALPRGAGRDFFLSLTLEQLAKAQGVKPLHDPGILAGVWPEDDDIDEFIEDLYRSRRN